MDLKKKEGFDTEHKDHKTRGTNLGSPREKISGKENHGGVVQLRCWPMQIGGDISQTKGMKR